MISISIKSKRLSNTTNYSKNFIFTITGLNIPKLLKNFPKILLKNIKILLIIFTEIKL